MPLPFCFAWVDATDATFGVAHQVEDEKIFSFKLSHSEAGKPTLAIEILNPYAGLLGSSRKQWAWFSRYDGAAYKPEFFGRLMGIPDSLFGETVTLVLVADPPDFLARKQAVAETLKIRPFYDPVFLDAAHRDDADAILEGWCADYHVDRVTHDVTISDRLIGEDGLITFGGDDVFYDSVTLSLDQPPLAQVEMDATIGWTQQASGLIDLGANVVSSFSGDGLISDWPKPLQNLQGGWSVAAASAIDLRGVGSALTASWSYQWQNTERFHSIGDTMSVSISQSLPQIDTNSAVSRVLTSRYVIGIVDPYQTDENGKPAPVNIPAQVNETTAYVPLWQVSTSLTLRYDAARSRQERVRFTLTAGLQDILTAPDAATAREIVTLNAADVGVPLLDVKNQIAVRGEAVDLGEVISVPASLSPAIANANFQICIAAGTTSATEPAYSATLGVLTVDGTATWASLGATLQAELPDWSAAATYATGTVIRPKAVLWTTYEQLLPSTPAPTVGVSVEAGRVVRRNSGASFQICTTAGTTGPTEPGFSDTRGATTNDGTAQWTCLGASVPDGTSYWLATTGGTAGTLEPAFSGGAGSALGDGSVTWTGLGTGGNFIGVPIGDVSRRSYLPTARGLWSLEYLISVARAKMLTRARAVKVGVSGPIDRFDDLSCRMNGRLLDARLPGGVATGKIVDYNLTGDGDHGEFLGSATLACAVGLGGLTVVYDGAPTVWEADVAGPDVQAYAGRIITAGLGDFGYSVPQDVTADDGLVFPLTRDQAVLTEQWHGTLAAQQTAIGSALEAARRAANLPPVTGVVTSIQNQQATARAGQNSVANALKTNPIWLELELAPVTGSSFAVGYAISVQSLSVPKMIDLAA